MAKSRKVRVSQELPPVRHLGKRADKSGRTLSQPPPVFEELPPVKPVGGTSKRQVLLPPEVLPVAKKLRPTPVPVPPEVLLVAKKVRPTPVAVPPEVLPVARKLRPTPPGVTPLTPAENPHGSNIESGVPEVLPVARKLCPLPVTSNPSLGYPRGSNLEGVGAAVLPLPKKLRPAPVGIEILHVAKMRSVAELRVKASTVNPLPRNPDGSSTATEVLPIPRKINRPPPQVTPANVNLSGRPTIYNPADYDPTNPKVWHNALLEAHYQLRESPETRIPYGQAANFHIRASEVKLAEEEEITSDLGHLKSKLTDLRRMLQTRLND